MANLRSVLWAIFDILFILAFGAALVFVGVQAARHAVSAVEEKEGAIVHWTRFAGVYTGIAFSVIALVYVIRNLFGVDKRAQYREAFTGTTKTV